ncbi:D-inositol-3-phosphate glycosyltransferase [Sporomusa carbonis]|uniref:glycosyltransferase family 4 protein n=1 Tax=Sporomusa carbonis TaxID=3076075 RepID=UPI003A735CAE
MVTTNRIRNVAFLSTYPPRECGLATFTQDLVQALDAFDGLIKTKVIAVSNGEYYNDQQVMAELSQNDKSSYLQLAKKINESDIDLLVIEHEYGIFGGTCGDYIGELIKNLQVPVITTLHTVLPNPSFKQKQVLSTLGAASIKVVTMARNTMKILQNVYDINAGKIEVIPHGVPFRLLEPRDKLKEKNGYASLNIIATFGLISPGKGLEYGIEAIAEVVKDHPNTLYLILGKTHPCIKNEQGENYREKLLDLTHRLGLDNHVRFIDKYLTKEEIIYYLRLCDIYLTPYLSKDQAVSGTLAYAVGCGRVVVSTPYLYAQELLGDGRGLLAEFRDPNSIAKCIKYVLDNPDKKREMELRTAKLGQTMLWRTVAAAYFELFLKLTGDSKNAGTKVS